MAGPIDARTPKWRFDGWVRGVNKEVSSFDLLDSEVITSQNVRFATRGTAEIMSGSRRYDDLDSEHLNFGNVFARNLYQYKQSDGSREFILITNSGRIYTDRDTTLFEGTKDFFTFIPPSDDGLVNIAQWKDTVIYSSQNFDQWMYQRGQPTENGYLRVNPQVSTAAEIAIFNTVTTGSGDLDSGKRYIYRYAFEFYHGNDFMGMSEPAFQAISNDSGLYKLYGQYSITGATHIVLLKDKELPSTISDFAKYLLIFRTVGLSDNIIQSNPSDQFGLMARIATSDYDDAAIGETIFTDDGTQFPNFSSRPRYGTRIAPPRSKFAVPHKNRVFYLNIGETAGFPIEETVTENKYGCWYSEYLEPAVVRETSNFSIASFTTSQGEEIIQAKSWKNKAVFVWKKNSFWGIFGGDNETINIIGGATGVIDIEIEVIDESVGCIAPNSLVDGEGGYIWLSNRGIEFFKGTKPKLLGGEDDRIKAVLDNIPEGQKYYSAGVYIEKTRKYRLYVAQSDQDPSSNTDYIEYDFRNDSFALGRIVSTNTYGVNFVIEAKDRDEGPTVFAAIDRKSTEANTITGMVQILDDVMYVVNTDDPVQWTFQTKYYDLGLPDIEKRFLGVLLRVEAPQPFTFAYDVDEGSYAGSTTVTTTTKHTWNEANLNWQGSPIETPTHIWDGINTQEKLIMIPDTGAGVASQNVRGRRISFTFSGNSTLKGLRITGGTIFFTAEERIRQTGVAS
jgi:hypothetical protein